MRYFKIIFAGLLLIVSIVNGQEFNNDLISDLDIENANYLNKENLLNDSLITINSDYKISYTNSIVKRTTKDLEVYVKLYSKIRPEQFSINGFELNNVSEIISGNELTPTAYRYVIKHKNLNYTKFDKQSIFYSLPNEENLTIHYFANNKEVTTSVKLNKLINKQL
jgi:hypothetical protein